MLQAVGVLCPLLFILHYSRLAVGKPDVADLGHHVLSQDKHLFHELEQHNIQEAQSASRSPPPSSGSSDRFNPRLGRPKPNWQTNRCDQDGGSSCPLTSSCDKEEGSRCPTPVRRVKREQKQPPATDSSVQLSALLQHSPTEVPTAVHDHVAALPFDGLLHDHMTDVPVGSHSDATTMSPLVSQGETAAAAGVGSTVSPPALSVSGGNIADHPSGLGAALSSMRRLGLLSTPPGGGANQAAGLLESGTEGLKPGEAREEPSSNPKIILGKVLVGPVVTNSTVDDGEPEPRDGNKPAANQTRLLVEVSAPKGMDTEHNSTSQSIMRHYKERIAEFAHTLEITLNQELAPPKEGGGGSNESSSADTRNQNTNNSATLTPGSSILMGHIQSLLDADTGEVDDRDSRIVNVAGQNRNPISPSGSRQSTNNFQSVQFENNRPFPPAGQGSPLYNVFSPSSGASSPFSSSSSSTGNTANSQQQLVQNTIVVNDRADTQGGSGNEGILQVFIRLIKLVFRVQ